MTFYAIGDLILAGEDTYRVEDILGKGGMARVYLAREMMLNKLVVVKVLDPELAAKHPLIAKAFQLEARALAQMESEHLPRVSKLGLTSDDARAHFYIMDRIAGRSLKKLLDYHWEKHGTKALRLDQALNLGSQAAQGLGTVHEYGIVHCDIKPDNLFLYTGDTGQTRVKILDFGVSRVLDDIERTRSFMGTPAYGAPEQLLELDLSVKADVFALGLVVFEMITGRWAYQATGTGYESALRRAHEAAPSLASHGDFPPVLVDLVTRALDLDPARRPDAFAMAAELRKIGRELAPRNAHEVKTDPNLDGHASSLASEMRPISYAEVSSTDVDVDMSELMRRVEAARVASADTEPRATPFASPTAPLVDPLKKDAAPGAVRIHRTVRMPQRPVVDAVTMPPSRELPAPASDRSGLYADDPAPRLPASARLEPTPVARRVAANESPDSRHGRPTRRPRLRALVVSCLVGMLVTLAGYGLFVVVERRAPAARLPSQKAGASTPTSAAGTPP